MASSRQSVEMSMEERIAIFLASLDEETAAAVLQQLDTDLMARLVGSIRDLGVIPGAIRDTVMATCLKEIHELGQSVFGDDKLASSLLVKAIGEKRAGALLSDDNTRKESPFADLRQADPDELANTLIKEQPMVSALVLQYLPSVMAADVLGKFSVELRKQVLLNMATSGASPNEDVIAGIEELLKSKLVHSRSKKAQTIEAKDKVDVLSGILQHVDGSMEEELLNVVEENSKELASQLRDKLFTFEDVVNLSDVALRRILQEIDSASLSIVLRNGSVALKSKFFNNMSKRAAEGLKEDMQNSPKLRLAEIEAKQREVVNIIRALESQGQITISKGEADVYI